MFSTQTNNYSAISVDRSQWYDKERESPKAELALRVMLYVLGAAILVGTIVATYYCFTTTSHIGMRTTSNDWLSFIPIMFGGVGTVVSFIGAGTMQHIKTLEKKTFEDPVEQAKVRVALMDTLPRLITTMNLNRESTGIASAGLGPWVRHGLLTPEEGDKLVVMIKTYQDNKALKARFENEPAFLTKLKEIKEKDPTFASEYDEAKSLEDKMLTDWDDMKKKIAVNQPRLSIPLE